MKSLLKVCLALVATMIALPVGAVETNYNVVSETTYKPPTLRRELIQPVSTETSFNPRGTQSASIYGLISTRRDKSSFPLYLLGMQDASATISKQSLNVSTLNSETLSDQANELVINGVQVFLVDAPNPEEAKTFFSNSKLLKRKAVLLSSSLPRGFSPPMVITSPYLSAERIGEEGIRLVGNVEVKVGYILSVPSKGADEKEKKHYEGLMKAFQKPFDNVAPKITLEQINPALRMAPKEPLPAVICVLTEEDSSKWAAILKTQYPGAKIVCTGQTPEVISAFEAGLIDVRVHPDYARVYMSAMREAENKSQLPLTLLPVADKNIKK